MAKTPFDTLADVEEHQHEGVQAVVLQIVWPLVIIVGFLICGSVALPVVEKRPSLLDKAIVLAAFAAIAGAIAGILSWSFKQVTATLQQRAQLLILEKLSQVDNLTYTELRAMIQACGIQFRAFDWISTNAIATLVKDKMVVVRDGQYTTQTANDQK